MKKFKDFIIEFYETPSEFAPKFRKQTEEDIAKRGTPHHTFRTDRFHVKAFDDGENRMYTVHDKKTGEHIGTMYGAKVSSHLFRVDEVSRDLSSKHKQVMPEVYHHILNRGTSLMSSGSENKLAHGIWKSLHGKGYTLHLVKPSYDSQSKITGFRYAKNGKNTTPDFKAHVQKPSKNMLNNATHYLIQSTKKIKK